MSATSLTLEDIAPRYRGRRMGDAYLIECPSGAHTRQRIRAKLWAEPNGTIRVWCYACDSSRPALEGLRAAGLPIDGKTAGPVDPLKIAAARERQMQDLAARRELALGLFRDCRPIRGSLGEQYLVDVRGLTRRDWRSLRFHSALKHACGTRHAAIVAQVVGVRGEPIGIHRTFLGADGRKADCGIEPKMMLGSVAGGAVRLAPAADCLVIGEGLESTLSAGELLGIPTAWAALSAGGIERLELPELVRKVVIAADRDHAGIGAARKAARRWTREGREVCIRAPQGYDDWNDALVGTLRDQGAA